MLLSDHINFQNANPLIGPNLDDWENDSGYERAL